MQRLNTRCLGDIGDDVAEVVESLLQLFGSGEGRVADQLGRVQALKAEVESLSDSKARVAQFQTKLAACENMLLAYAAHPSGGALKTASTQTDSEVATPSASGAKRQRVTTPLLQPNSPATPSKSAVSDPQQQPSPMRTPLPPPESLLDGLQTLPTRGLGLTLSEGDMVRIASSLVFSLMRVAQRADGHISSLSELFVECDSDGDNGLSFTEFLQWVRGRLGVPVRDWQLDEFGKRLNWDAACRRHPRGYIDLRGFCDILKDVWGKVKWYFNTAVTYGLSDPQVAMYRSQMALDKMDTVREPLHDLIRYLVTERCHIHSFFAMWDKKRLQELPVDELAKAFLQLGIGGVETEEDALALGQRVADAVSALFTRPGASFESKDRVSVVQLQDVVREVFNEFTSRLELNVFAAEARSQFLFRHILFGICGVSESTDTAQPIANVFTHFSKHASSPGGLSTSDFSAMLRTEFRVTLTTTELRQVVSMSDINHDNHLGLSELVRLLELAREEMCAEMKRRMPNDFVPAPGMYGPGKLTPEATFTCASFIMRLLHTEESFADFFKSIPKFRPSGFANGQDETRYPDEVVCGLRRLGVHAKAQDFEGLGGSFLEGWTGFRWAPSRSVLDLQHYLQYVWNVWETVVLPAFNHGINFENEASRVSARALEVLWSEFNAPANASQPPIQHLWNMLAQRDGGVVRTENFVSTVMRCIKKRQCEHMVSLRSLTSQAMIRNTAENEDVFRQELLQLIHLSGASDSTLTEDQLGRILCFKSNALFVTSDVIAECRRRQGK
ncbi:hypothetical protein DIPPA_07775 [Diplonema papillatum]|nr:hypothetical protein DIPPA_07775 [Diplonema papillatum]